MSNLKQSIMTKEQFLKAIQGTQFEADLQVSLLVNGGDMGRGVWNLICSIRDVKLFCKGMKIHRNWRLSDVKWYFGVKGGKQKVADALEVYRDVITAMSEEYKAQQN